MGARFEPVPAPEHRAEVEATLRAKLEAAEVAARAKIAAEMQPERLAEMLAEHGWTVLEPTFAADADVRSLRPA